METDLLKKLRDKADDPEWQVIGAVSLWVAADYIHNNYVLTVREAKSDLSEASDAVRVAVDGAERAEAAREETRKAKTLVLAEKGELYAERLTQASLHNLIAQYEKLCEETNYA